ncbi:cilia- and flagella-associated protein 77 [Xenentodon cancila]
MATERRRTGGPETRSFTFTCRTCWSFINQQRCNVLSPQTHLKYQNSLLPLTSLSSSSSLLFISPTRSMALPGMGMLREAMRTDPVLTQGPLGKGHFSHVALPSPDFTYGARSNWNADGGVAEALSSWRVQSRHEKSAPRPDFVSLNRDAVKSGLVTSKELSQYRAQRIGATVQSHLPKQHEGGASRRLPPPPPPDIIFGVTNRFSAPMADILSHEYARRWVDEQLNQTSSHKSRMKTGRAAETRTSLLRKSTSLPVAHKPFRLPQFTQVAPALDTFRDPKARQQAFRAHQSTSVS